MLIISEDQNCMAYQLGTSIYYNTIKDVVIGQELMVWYAPQYAKKLGKSVVPDGISKVMLNMKVIYPSVDELPESKPFNPLFMEQSRQTTEMEQSQPDSPPIQSQTDNDSTALSQQNQVCILTKVFMLPARQE
ncbi:hypothetical protein FSP39_010593 [Pinctada imbricata]|uniref:SET domain-containing protein n=1 Tax=Pinctada imbricata TaxID=66713 RepID=A0AA88XU92_PINIB|nr:hypothetical protein FSP39_010593 [Pinctada imbricata]